MRNSNFDFLKCHFVMHYFTDEQQQQQKSKLLEMGQAEIVLLGQKNEIREKRCEQSFSPE